MKKILLVFSTLSVLAFIFSVPIVRAVDDSNVNVTKRRPDRPSTFSPSPLATITPAEVKQVTPPKRSWLTELWAKIRAIFQK